MSYCRFQTNPPCDLYIYDNMSGGITINVRKRRRKHWRDCPIVDTASIESLITTSKAVEEWLRNHPKMEEIGLSRDGGFYEVSPLVARGLVEEMSSEGYFVPDYVIEALEERCT